MPNKHSCEEIVIFEESKKQLRMKEEKACLMSKKFVSLRSSLRQRLKRLESFIRSLWMNKIDMSFLLNKLRSLD